MVGSPQRPLRRRVLRAACVTATVALAGWLAVELGLRFLRTQDVAEACGRSFERADTISDDELAARFGVVHKVGESRQDDALYTWATAWPTHCEGAAPTLVFSHKSHGDWQVWILRGGQ